MTINNIWHILLLTLDKANFQPNSRSGEKKNKNVDSNNSNFWIACFISWLLFLCYYCWFDRFYHFPFNVYLILLRLPRGRIENMVLAIFLWLHNSRNKWGLVLLISIVVLIVYIVMFQTIVTTHSSGPENNEVCRCAHLPIAYSPQPLGLFKRVLNELEAIYRYRRVYQEQQYQ